MFMQNKISNFYNSETRPIEEENLVMVIYKELGYVNRQSLINAFNISPRKAGLLIREFINTHGKNIKWNESNKGYSIINPDQD